MAIIKCPECGGTVSDSASNCPHCGFNIASLQHCEECNSIINESEASCSECGCPTPWSRKCPKCGNYVLPTDTTCPECGFDLVSHYGRVQTISSNLSSDPGSYGVAGYSGREDVERPSKKKWKIVGGSLIAIVVVAACWLIYDNYFSDNKDCHADAQESYQNEFDGIYEWSVLFSDYNSRYKEEFGCEIANGKVTKATWYTPHANTPLSGQLEGNILTLKGNNKSNPQIWVECTIDLRTGRGTIATPLTSTTNVRYERLNLPTQSNSVQESTTTSSASKETLRADYLLDKLDSNVTKLQDLITRHRNGENVELELDAYMRVDDSKDIIIELNTLSESFSREQQERYNRITQKYQGLL